MKTKILYKEGIQLGHQNLEFAGRKLDDDFTLSDYKIVDNSTLILHIFRTEGMYVYVRCTDSLQPLILEVEALDTIGRIERKVQDKGGYYIEQQKLTFEGRCLEDGFTLFDYHIEKESTIWLELSPTQTMEIFVKTLSGKAITLQATARNTIENVKNKI